MDTTSALNWLPAGITSLILSLERTDSLAVQFKAFSVTQAVKSLLSTKTTQEGPWDNRPCASRPKGFNSIFSSDALRDLAKPNGASIHGISLNPSAGQSGSYPCCWCDEEEFCVCHHHGCGDPDCVVCEPCTSEEEFECEFEDHHGTNWASAPELQYHWGFPLSGSLLSSRPNSQSLRGADWFYKGRRDSRSLRFGTKDLTDAHGQALETGRLGDSFERLLGSNPAVTGNNTVQVGQGWKRVSQGSTSDSSAHEKRDGAKPELRACSEQDQNPMVEAIPSKLVHEPTREGRQSGNAKRHSEVQREGVERPGIITAVQEKEQIQSNKQNPAQRASAIQWSSIGQAFAAMGERGAAAGQSAESENSSIQASNLMNKWNFRMGQNAIAGALAGGFVSLCLHPIDTLKTVVQAQTGRNRNLVPILSSIISERGIKGLYRGLGSNLASSAPTSAIYTLTYEAVKAGLLRHLPVDMSALAHCAAGGCASVATSIVYTPSECVKQQMQVNSLYRNSWLTFTGLLRQGGLPMLYNGWGAVLCRNVPQSVIKFYTYEGLKVWVQGDQPSGTPLSTVQALAIGGVAGSTAAFFTTPFDVVKTRLQTQVPGTIHQYNGVFHAFQCIAAKEGVAGLYRGLVPRLLIYVTQGALFFASYEFMKHVLAVEVPRVRIKTSQIEGPKSKAAPFPVEST